MNRCHPFRRRTSKFVFVNAKISLIKNLHFYRKTFPQAINRGNLACIHLGAYTFRRRSSYVGQCLGNMKLTAFRCAVLVFIKYFFQYFRIFSLFC